MYVWNKGEEGIKGDLKMKRIGMLTMAIVASLVFVVASFAGYEKSSAETAAAGEEHGMKAAESASSEHYIGMEVVNQQGERIGIIKELIKNQETGQIDLVVLSKGGFMGIADSKHTVPFSAFSFEGEENALLLTVDEGLLANAPERESGMSDAEFGRRLHEHYGLAPAWEEGEMPEETPAEPEKKMMEE